MTVDIELDKEDDRILETIDNGITKVGLNAENMKDLEQKEKEYIQELRDADKIFGDDRNSKEIELLDSIENDQEWSPRLRTENAGGCRETYESQTGLNELCRYDKQPCRREARIQNCSN